MTHDQTRYRCSRCGLAPASSFTVTDVLLETLIDVYPREPKLALIKHRCPDRDDGWLHYAPVAVAKALSEQLERSCR